MAKRFIDTGLFDDEWFLELPIDAKVFWLYYITKCDHAGLLKYNKKLVEFQTGIKSLETVIKHFANRLVTVNEQLFFCPKFIEFQYPDFPKSKVRQQASAIDLLVKNGLWDLETHNFKELTNSYQTVNKDLPKSYGNGNVNGNGNEDDNDKIKKSEKLKFPFTSEKFLSAWNDWLKFRSEIKKPYRSEMSKQTALKTLSRHDEQTAIAMIEQSIGNGWQGLFEVKTKTTNKGKFIQ